MLRVGDQPPADQPDKVHHLAVDKKKRQVTLNEPSVLTSSNSAQERAPMVSAPKMFAFDSLFTSDDSQVIRKMKLFSNFRNVTVYTKLSVTSTQTTFF
jgi:hypothetical protein